jgi:hypothetical protein
MIPVKIFVNIGELPGKRTEKTGPDIRVLRYYKALGSYIFKEKIPSDLKYLH